MADETTETGLLGPDTSEDLEVKQGVVNLAKNGTTHLRVSGIRGKYRDAQFDDDCVSLDPVSDKTRAMLRDEYPNAEFEDIEKSE